MSSPARILIVDDDEALLSLLSTVLNDAGCDVETIVGAEGFTPDLMALGRPALVLINPLLKGMDRRVLEAVLKEFRRSARRPILLFADLPAEALADHAAALQADGYLPIRDLLRDPGLIVGPSQVAQPHEEAEPPGPTVGSLNEEEILGLELELGTGVSPEPTPPPRPPPAPPKERSALAASVLAAINDELANAESPVEGVEHFNVTLDMLGDANLYADEKGRLLGVFISSALPPSPGAKVDLMLTLPWGAQLAFEAVVEWTRPTSKLGRRIRGGFGAGLPALKPPEKAALERFATLRAPIRGTPAKVA